MILESFFSGLISGILKDVITHAIVDRRKRLDENQIEKVVAAYLLRHQSTLSTTMVTKEIYIILGNSGFTDGHGQVIFSPPEDKKTPDLLVSLLERNYVESVKRRLGSPISSEERAGPSERGTTGLVQRFEGSKDDPVRASLYWTHTYGAYPVWGWIARYYQNLGEARSRLGFPISSEMNAAPSERGTPGQVQRFEGGKDDPREVSISLYCSHYGAFPTWGWIARCYEGFGGTGSRLGFPISPELPAAASQQGTAGQVQRFEGNGDGESFLDNISLTGVSIYCSPHGAYATWGEIGRCYERLGGTGSQLGFPISPEQETHPSSRGHTVWRQRFEGGEISCEWGSDPVVHT